MQNKPVALVTGANQGIGLQIAKDIVAHEAVRVALLGADGPTGRSRAGKTKQSRGDGGVGADRNIGPRWPQASR